MKGTQKTSSRPTKSENASPKIRPVAAQASGTKPDGGRPRQPERLQKSLGEPSGPNEKIQPSAFGDRAQLWVDPASIRLTTVGLSSKLWPDDFRRALMGPEPSVVGGDWDNGAWGNHITPFDSTDVFRAFEAHFIRGEAWEATNYYKRVRREISRGIKKWGCTTEEEFRQRCLGLDHLYTDILLNGYKTQNELSAKPIDEIRVGVRRDGTFVHFDGRHRLSIAKLLRLEKVPVRVLVRHQDWAEFRREIGEYIAGRPTQELYQAVDHPDLDDFPASHSDDRFGIIKKALGGYDCRGKRALDVGTHWGHMCQQLETLGFSCTGIESSRQAVYFGRRLATATNSTYEMWHGDLSNFPESRYDVVLALNIFHHLLMTQKQHEQLIAFLKRVSADVLFFQPHVAERSRSMMKGAYRNYDPEEFALFVSQHAGLQNVELLGQASDHRPIYKLTR